jgi:hypothetical protein
MNAQTLQERIAQVESKRALLLKFKTDPTLGTLSLDVDELMMEFQRTFPNGVVVAPPIIIE